MVDGDPDDARETAVGEETPTDGSADEFLVADLLAATMAQAASPHSSVQGWGQATLDAVERLTDERGRYRVDRPLIDTMKNSARYLHQAITPFQGMLEAPRSVAAVYQTHRLALSDVVLARDKVLGDVLADLATRAMDQLQPVSWSDLEALGAVRQQPAGPTGYDELEP